MQLRDHPMKIVFTKGSGKYDLMEVFRNDREPERVECPKQRIIPHDMVHYAVEQTLQTRGFLGRVKEGEPAGFKMKPEPQTDSVERLVEVFQGDEWSGGQTSAIDMIEMYRVTCLARECPALPLDEAAIQAVRTTIAGLSARWQSVPVGGAMHLGL
jgi:hypothetical protein